MASEKPIESATKLINLLRKRLFVEKIDSHALKTGVSYRFGPSGVILKKNIIQSWWNWMVTTQRNTYPVESNLITGVETDSQSSGLCSIRKGLSKDCYNHFPQICSFVNYKLPFTIVQTGTCIASNVPSSSEDKILFDSVTTTNLVSQQYCPPSDNTKAFDNLLRYRLQWWRQFSGNPSKFTASEINVREDGTSLALIKFEFPWGVDTIEAITNKGDKPLKLLEEQGVSVQCKNGNKSVIPHIIESNMVLERGLIAYLFDAFKEKQKVSFKKKEADTTCSNNRPVLQFSTAFAPYKVALAISGSRTREVKEIATHLLLELKKAGLETLDFDDVSSLENQIIRNDEMGIPFTVVVNDNTLETGIVSCRNRDTTLKEQTHITKLKENLMLQLN